MLSHSRQRSILVVVLLSALALALITLLMMSRAHPPTSREETATNASPPDVDESLINELCSHCHRRPPPDALPKSSWDKTVWTMSQFGGFGVNVPRKIDVEGVARWFRERAPETLQLPPVNSAQGPGSLRMKRRIILARQPAATPFASHVRIGNVTGDNQPEVLVCDMRNGKILLGKPASANWSLDAIGDVPFPAHVEPADLNGDGKTDLIAANLGSFLAMDHKLGSVEWLRQAENGSFQRVTLAADLGRVADVQPADIDGDGDLDLVVGEFGWRWTGHLLLLENRGMTNGVPSFVPRAIDGLHGNSHVAILDLNDDGRRDILALFSQEHEMVRAYLNLGQLAFDARDLHRAPHPAWGSSGFQLVDLDGDKDADVLLTNGDTYDDSLLKPYHGIRWLENCGSLQFVDHPLVVMYGVFKAEAADLDGDGDLDIAACAMSETTDPTDTKAAGGHDSILWLEQTSQGRFVHRIF